MLQVLPAAKPSRRWRLLLKVRGLSKPRRRGRCGDEAAAARHGWTSSGSLFIGVGVHDVDLIGQSQRLK